MQDGERNRSCKTYCRICMLKFHSERLTLQLILGNVNKPSFVGCALAKARNFCAKNARVEMRNKYVMCRTTITIVLGNENYIFLTLKTRRQYEPKWQQRVITWPSTTNLAIRKSWSWFPKISILKFDKSNTSRVLFFTFRKKHLIVKFRYDKEKDDFF